MSNGTERRPQSSVRGGGEPPRALSEQVAPVVEALPGLARVAASAAWHTGEWGVRSYVRSAKRLARAATDRDEAAHLAQEATEAAQVVSDLARAVSGGTPVGTALLRAAESLGAVREPAGRPAGPVVPGGVADAEEPRTQSLRERGAELLERSRDVWSSEAGHPAYERMLGELAPDEARILLLLLEKGPQPSVDVRTGGPIGMVSSQLIAPGLTMIGARSGARYVEQVPAYLNNLHRLGLVWFSREPLRDPMEYQVLEAQPDVLAAMHSVKFAKVVRRSIHLTPFGEDFCRTVLVDEQAAGRSFPEHQAPPEAHSGEPSGE
ncbi:MAG: Abi-alpha family protein [Nocardioides sp.]